MKGASSVNLLVGIVMGLIDRVDLQQRLVDLDENVELSMVGLMLLELYLDY